MDIDYFKQARGVTEALRDRKCGPALAWCAANAAKLRKLNSSLEFDLLVQEFVELARGGDVSVAVDYARRKFAPWAKTHVKVRGSRNFSF